MEEFLKESKKTLKHLKSFNEVHVVLGNEACDLDSAISALLYGFLLFKLNRSPDIAILPLLNIPKKDFKLKTDVSFFFDENDIKLDDLVFKDEIDLLLLHDSRKLKLILVDHNVLSQADNYLENDIIEIIDHHKKCKDYSNVRCRIEGVGSCSTLIAEKIFENDPNIIDFNIAVLLFGTILLDTVFLDDKAGRVTPKDKEIAEKLKAHLPDVDSEDLYQSLQNARNDISGLNIEELLRRDLKIISSNAMTIAITSVPLLVEDLLKRSTIATELQKFGLANSFHVIVIMGIQADEKTKEVSRQIAVFSCSDAFREQVCDVLVRSSELQLEQLEFEISGVSIFQQKNTSASRKTVLPLLNSFLLDGNLLHPHYGSTKILIQGKPQLQSFNTPGSP